MLCRLKLKLKIPAALWLKNGANIIHRTHSADSCLQLRSMSHWNVCTRSGKRSRVHTTLDITGPAGVVLHLSSFSQPTDTSQNKNVGLLHGEPMSNFTVRVCVISFPAPPCSLSEGERGNRELQTKYEKTHSSEAVWRVCEKVEDRVQEMDTLKRGKEEEECVWLMCVCVCV